MIELEAVGKRYTGRGADFEALRDITFGIDAGEFVAIVGPSGSGKSTLLNLLGCLDVPTTGRYALCGSDVARLGEEQRTALRAEHIGFVFQGFHLLGSFTALENVEMPLLYRGIPAARRRALAREALDRVGLSTRTGHRPSQLSGGQQQRVAIARAIVTQPDVLLADEPTGNLDAASSRDVMALLGELHAQGNTVVLITHDERVAHAAPRALRIEDGTLARDEGREAVAGKEA